MDHVSVKQLVYTYVAVGGAPMSSIEMASARTVTKMKSMGAGAPEQSAKGGLLHRVPDKEQESCEGRMPARQKWTMDTGSVSGVRSLDFGLSHSPGQLSLPRYNNAAAL